VSVSALREGWDDPFAEVCLMLRPWKSRTGYVQTLGRILRLLVDDSPKISLIIDPYFQQSALAPLSAPMVFGRPGQRLSDGGLIGEDAGDANTGRFTLTVSAPIFERECRMNDQGMITLDGLTYGSRDALIRMFGRDEERIRQSDGQDIRKRSVRTVDGKRRLVYCIDDVTHAAALFSRRFRSNHYQNGRQWMSPQYFFNHYGLPDTLERYERIERAGLLDILRMHRREPRRMYLLADLYELFADEIRNASEG
jgi:hypothetical protein